MAFSYSEITSRKNDKIVWAAKLSDKKRRDADGVFFTDGTKLLTEAVSSGFEIEKVFFTAKALSLYADLLESASAAEYFLVSDEVFEKLTDEVAPQGVFSVIKKPVRHNLSYDETNGGFLILEDVQNPLNLGAIFRCAYSLGFDKIVLTKGCADIYNPKTLRSAMGSIFKCRIYRDDDICPFIRTLKEKGKRVFCTHLHSESQSLDTFSFNDGDSIVMGNEGHGVSERVLGECTGSVIIPMNEGAESLNAATAAAIIMWEMKKARQQTNI